MIRVAVILIFLTLLFLALLPFQIIGIVFNTNLQRTVPHLFHRVLCKVIGVRIHEIGTRTRESPALILANHASWLDIPVIGAMTPVVFVAKSEVATWPVFGLLAKLQRTIFIERERRHKTGEAAREMAERLRGGDAVLLFPEGTSSDGVRILPFRSALIGAVHHAIGDSTHHQQVTVQPVSIAYTARQGLPLGPAGRMALCWIGDQDLLPHISGLLRAGAVDAEVRFGEPVIFDARSNRKETARLVEARVRDLLEASLRGNGRQG